MLKLGKAGNSTYFKELTKNSQYKPNNHLLLIKNLQKKQKHLKAFLPFLI